MTSDEATRIHQRIDELAKDMNNGFRQVETQVSTLLTLMPLQAKQIERHGVDIYGLPGNTRSAGLVGRVANLEQSRGYLRYGLWIVWTALVAIIGALIGRM